MHDLLGQGHLDARFPQPAPYVKTQIAGNTEALGYVARKTA
jgi:hypothetical protein